MMIFSYFQGELNRRRGRYDFRTLCCDVFSLLKTQFLRNNNNKGSRFNVNKHELVYGESSSYARFCLSFVLLFTINYCCYAKTSSSAVQKRHVQKRNIIYRIMFTRFLLHICLYLYCIFFVFNSVVCQFVGLDIRS